MKQGGPPAGPLCNRPHHLRLFRPPRESKQFWASMRGRIAIVHQPRDPGATDETAALRGKEIAAKLARAGFADVRTETLGLKPAVVCVLGINRDR